MGLTGPAVASMLRYMQRNPRRRAPPHRIRVLICDDHELIRIALAAVLSAADMEIIACCSDGAQAVTLAEQRRPDVALVDLSMPAMDGIETTRRIVSVAPSTKIIILTAGERGSDTEAALRAGAASVVLKGEGVDSVVNAIRSLPP